MAKNIPADNIGFLETSSSWLDYEVTWDFLPYGQDAHVSSPIGWSIYEGLLFSALTEVYYKDNRLSPVSPPQINPLKNIRLNYLQIPDGANVDGGIIDLNALRNISNQLSIEADTLLDLIESPGALKFLIRTNLVFLTLVRDAVALGAQYPDGPARREDDSFSHKGLLIPENLYNDETFDPTLNKLKRPDLEFPEMIVLDDENGVTYVASKKLEFVYLELLLSAMNGYYNSKNPENKIYASGNQLLDMLKDPQLAPPELPMERIAAFINSSFDFIGDLDSSSYPKPEIYRSIYPILMDLLSNNLVREQ